MSSESPFDLEGVLLRDFAGALDRLDVDDLRAFMWRVASKSAADEDSLAFTLVEFAARKLEGAPWGEDDPTLADDAERWARAAKRKLRLDPSEIAALTLRARRQLLCGRAGAARRCYETIFAIVLELELASVEPDTPPVTVIPQGVFGSYLVSVYEDTEAAERVEAVLDAVVRLGIVGSLNAPLRMLEEHAIKPLPDFARFVEAWATTLENETNREGRPVVDPFSPIEALLAEALEKSEGLDGVARMARRARDLAHYRTWMTRLAEKSEWRAALDVTEEAVSALEDDHERTTVLDAGVAVAAKCEDMTRASELAERALSTVPTYARFARWLLLDSPDREKLLGRVRRAEARADIMTPRMKTLVCALLGAFTDVGALLLDAEEDWDDDENAGPLAYPSLLVAFYGGPKGTPIASKICAPLFSNRRRLAQPTSPDTPNEGRFFAAAELPTPIVGPAIVDALREVEGSRQHSDHLFALPELLREVASRRAAAVTSNRVRPAYESTALLIVSAAEATFRVGEQDIARGYLGEIAQAATRQSSFRTTITRVLAKSALVNAL